MVGWLRNNIYARWILTFVRIVVGWEWISAAVEKIGSQAWTGAKAGSGVSGFLRHAVTLSQGSHFAVQGW